MGCIMKMNPEVLKMRRRLVLAIVRREPGCRAVDVHRELLELHEKGQWPQMPNPGAQNTPYVAQVASLLNFLVARGLLLTYRDPTDRWTRRWISPEGHKERAEALLPPQEDRARLLGRAREFQQRTGMELGFGVTEDLQQVVRVLTERGALDFPLNPYTDELPWDEAIQDALDDLLVAA